MGTTVLCKRKNCPYNKLGVCIENVIDIHNCEKIKNEGELMVDNRQLLID